MDGKSGPFAFELEHDESTVVTYIGRISAKGSLDACCDRTGSKQVEIGVCGKDPESVVFSPEGLDCGALCKVPYTDCLVLATRNDEFVFRMEERVGHIVKVPSARVDLPSLCFAHPPNLDGAIVGGGDDEGKGGVEGGEIDASVMALEDILYGREGVERFKAVRTRAGSALSQTGYVPDAHCLVHGCRDDEVVLWMELGGHDIVRVAREDGDAVARCAVPYADCLVVGCRELRCGVNGRELRGLQGLTIQGIS